MRQRIKSMSKKELAQYLSIHPDTLRTWIEPVKSQLERVGYKKQSKIFSPRMVEMILTHLDAEANQGGEIGKPP